MLHGIDRDNIIDIERAEETEMRQAGRVDSNQAEIVQALRDVGCSVVILSDVGRGVPDLSVGYMGKSVWMEVKAPGGKLTPAEEKFRDNWHGSYAIVTSVDEALEAIGISPSIG